MPRKIVLESSGSTDPLKMWSMLRAPLRLTTAVGHRVDHGGVDCAGVIR